MDRGHPSKSGANGKGSNPGAVGRWQHLHTEPSGAAKAILKGRGVGDVLDGNGKRGVRDVNNTSKEGTVGKTMGTNRTAGNINTRG